MNPAKQNKVFHFEAIVYTCPEAKQILKQFMRLERNDENLVLLEHLDQLKKELKQICSSQENSNNSNVQQWKINVESIWSKYLSLENFMVNVSLECIKEVLAGWKEIKSEESNEELLRKFEKMIKPLEVFLLVMIKSDVFPRFVRSTTWVKYIESLKPSAIREAFLEKVTMNDAVYQIEKSFQYTYQTIFASSISLRDYQFAKMMCEDDLAAGWTFVAYDRKRTGVSLYVNIKKSFLSDQSVADEAQMIMASKYVGYLPVDLETAVFGTTGTLQQIKKMIPNVTNLDFANLVEPSTSSLEEKQLDYCFAQTHYTHQSDFKLPLLQKREGESNVTIFKIEEQNAYLCILKSTSVDCHPYTSNSIPLTHFMCMYFTRSFSDPNRTRYVHILLGDAGGWLRGKFNKLSAVLNKKRAIDQHKLYVKVVKQWASLSEEERKKAFEQDPGQLLKEYK